MNREDRRVRNRLSQKAFRARQALRIKELEQRLENLPESESERVSQLEEHNTLLRQRLFDNHKKMESLQVSLKALIDSTAKYLDLMVSDSQNRTKKKAGRFHLSLQLTDLYLRSTRIPLAEGRKSHPRRILLLKRQRRLTSLKMRLILW